MYDNKALKLDLSHFVGYLHGLVVVAGLERHSDAVKLVGSSYELLRIVGLVHSVLNEVGHFEALGASEKDLSLHDLLAQIRAEDVQHIAELERVILVASDQALVDSSCEYDLVPNEVVELVI